MPILENQRHELFAQELAKGKSATEAYQIAGYRPSRKNAARLRANEDVNARLQELQTITARSAEITIESICAELDQANQIAREHGQAAAMVSASTLRAKLAGLLVAKSEVQVNARVDTYSHCETNEQIAATMLRNLFTHLAPYEHMITVADEQAALAAMTTFSETLEDLVASIGLRAPWAQGSKYYEELEAERLERRRLGNTEFYARQKQQRLERMQQQLERKRSGGNGRG